ncbi:hypothetical protein E4U42_000745 [Claviceps africana]|uniref:protein-tyrosine-phosphatase n=1 Tax=Claviceps africana TaxID=83212 RepID=A0A8K0J0B9_9HYPO|nr:hypothetical protein E4U42_000745 [Claviceps africana]
MIEAMASAAARRLYEDQIPPLMSVFNLDAETVADGDTVTLVDLKMVDMDAKVPDLVVPSQPISLRRTTTFHSDSAHRHHDSTSTRISLSTDSSPTTTLSTTDSSPLSDPSPSSSPDSPVNLIPLSDYPSASFVRRPSTTHGNNNNNNNKMLSIPETQTPARPVTSPAPRKPKNMKGLSIQPPLSIATNSRCVSTEPSSPSFIKPTIPAMKRKPSQLSLRTNASDLTNKSSVEVPASPAAPPILQRRVLKHSTSSPHMSAAMKSSAFGPPGGMTFPKVLERDESGLSKVLRPTKCRPSTMELQDSIVEEDSPIRTQMANRNELEPFHECVNNEDQKSPGYPDGPIAIYSDNVYLYLEPTADEASQFDVVINVAREVGNPFEVGAGKPGGSSDGESPIPDTAVTDASFATAFEFQPAEDVPLQTPTTPKANPLRAAPEYIHVPWDHNTDIAPDLLNLCEIIEDRTKNGQKVLVHCQQGASRSASLIIAYGIYQSPELSVNDAYYAAQAKSRWISPNMKLMYSLQDFQKDLAKRRQPFSTSSAYRSRTGRSPVKHRLTLSADVLGVASDEPNTAPLPGAGGGGGGGVGGARGGGAGGGRGEGDCDALDANGPTRARKRISMSDLRAIPPGPASAPLSYSWRKSGFGSEPVTSPPSAAVSPTLASPSSPCPTTEKSELAAQSSPQLLMAAVPAPPVPSPRPAPSNVTKPEDAPKRRETDMDKPRSSSGAHSRKWRSLGLRAMETPAAFSSFPLRKFQGMGSAEPQDSGVVEKTIAVGSSYTTDSRSALLSPRAQTMTTNPLHQVQEVAGMRFVETAPTPTEGLFSPRETSFSSDSSSLFGRMAGFGRPSKFADPRSPPTKGEAPITRSIDDLI